MRTNIDIDDATLEAAMRAGPFKTKKDAVEAGLKLLARQAAYEEILKWQGKLQWDGDEAIDWAAPVSGSTPLPAKRSPAATRRLDVNEPAADYAAKHATKHAAKPRHGRR